MHETTSHGRERPVTMSAPVRFAAFFGANTSLGAVVSPYPAFDVVLLMLGGVTNIATAGRVIRYRSVEGLAVTWVMLTLFACVTWMLYGLWRHNVLQVITSAMTASSFAIVLVIAHHVRVARLSRSLLSATGLFLAISLLTFLAGSDGLGFAGLALTLLNRIPQVWKAIRSPGGNAVSLLGNGADATQSLLWTTIGVLRYDAWLAASSGYCLLSCTYVVVRARIARNGHFRVFHP